MLTRKAVKKILEDTRLGKLSSEKAFSRLKSLPYEAFSFARIDHHRFFRKGFPEAVYSPGKTDKQLEIIVRAIKKSGQPLIVTRLEKKRFTKLRKKISGLKYSDDACIAYLPVKAKLSGRMRGSAAVISAGTADQQVAEESALTLELSGRPVTRFYDCGVAGLHRLLDCLNKVEKSSVIICVAGMEGALPSVVAGLVSRPVIGVPTSVGYGVHLEGFTPLLAMLNSCAQGLAVVNIDNGYGAACFADQILQVSSV